MRNNSNSLKDQNIPTLELVSDFHGLNKETR